MLKLSKNGKGVAMIGRIFDIQRFSLHDGPGIRTTVFMKGCPLRCGWCHNPEGLEYKNEARFIKEECIGCGSCGGDHCIDNAETCPAGALSVCGRDISKEELLSEILRDSDFYGEDGGVSFSGGECLLQSEFITEVLKEVKALKISTVIDTSGAVSWENIKSTLPYTDLYLYDVKCIDPILHEKFTGKDNRLILKNLESLGDARAKIWIRVPVIPDFNDNLSEMEKIAEFVSSVKGVCRVTLMPYHTLGKNKYESLGKEPTYNTEKRISSEKLEEFKEIFRKKAIFTD